MFPGTSPTFPRRDGVGQMAGYHSPYPGTRGDSAAAGWRGLRDKSWSEESHGMSDRRVKGGVWMSYL